jgi:hypothetical protein
MSTPAANVVKIDWKQVCPWFVLFQTFGLALHVRQILVGSIAAIAIGAPQWYMLGESMPYVHFSPAPGNLTAYFWPLAPLVDLVSSLFHTSHNSAVVFPNGEISNPSQVLTWFDLGRGMLLTGWTLVVGGLAGGILTRRAAFEFAREESVGLWKSTRYVLGRSLDYFSAPLLPLCGVLAIGICGLVTGWVLRGLPSPTSLVAALWLVPLLFGVLAACLLFTVFAGWPMMVAAVSVNGGDGFDALSRGFGFVLDRWRYYAFCLLFLVAYGNVALSIVLTALQWGESFANSSISMGLSQIAHATTLGAANDPWHCFLSILLTGFAYSFFWSFMTVTYLLLRKSLDNAELDNIYLDENPNEPDGLAALLKKNPVPDPTRDLLPIITITE